jgi:LPXTG-site transpeptidase (sortase) family protein
MRKFPLWVKLIPLYAVFGVLGFLAVYIRQEQSHQVTVVAQQANQTISEKKNEVPAETPITGKPARIIAERAGINLPIVNGIYNTKTNEWVVKDGVGNFATVTRQLSNQAGTTLIYGHNNSYTFGRLNSLTNGDEVIVYSQEGHIFKYKFVSAEDVKPDDVSVFQNLDGKPMLKLLTCSGTWFQNRHIITLSLEQAVL